MTRHLSKHSRKTSLDSRLVDWSATQQHLFSFSVTHISRNKNNLDNQICITVAAPAPGSEQQFDTNVSQQTIDERLMFELQSSETEMEVRVSRVQQGVSEEWLVQRCPFLLQEWTFWDTVGKLGLLNFQLVWNHQNGCCVSVKKKKTFGASSTDNLTKSFQNQILLLNLVGVWFDLV